MHAPELPYSCACNVHHHHVYWRFDFDNRTAGNNIVRAFNDPPLFGGSNWHDKMYEVRRPATLRAGASGGLRKKGTGEVYDIISNIVEGLANAMPCWPFPHGDVWILRYRVAGVRGDCRFRLRDRGVKA